MKPLRQNIASLIFKAACAASVFFAACGANSATIYEPYTVTTIAGWGGHGSQDGVGSEARFYQPWSLISDSTGNLFVTDTGNQTIRKVTSDGVVTTLAGVPGEAGSSDGMGSAAHFNGPRDIGIDSAGNLYVADHYNFTLRKITPAGLVTTLAGLAGQPGFQDGIGSDARFFDITGVTVDSHDVVFVTDEGGIRRVTGAGVVTTLLPANTLSTEEGLGIDSQDNLYLAQWLNPVISKITPSGIVSTYASFVYGAKPYDVAFDSRGNAYVADFYWTVWKVTGTGTVTLFAGGSPGSLDGKGTHAQFQNPQGIAVDRSGIISVADTTNDEIRKIASKAVVSTLAGLANSGSRDGVGTEARFDYPVGLTSDANGMLSVADTGNETIRHITPEGVVTTLAGRVGQSGFIDGRGSQARFNEPDGIGVDAQGNVYVCDDFNSAIRKVTLNGRVTTLADNLYNPRGVVLDAAGNAYVADSASHTIKKIAPTGEVTIIAGQEGRSGDRDGIGMAALFNTPGGDCSG